ncbi:cell division protein ZapA [Neisseria leonii]|uniref:Cell division protein ZapA n=1 Tax=Neisseria leonii TaxID=2995413 RepID=A0A9X4E1Q0_9NEIS|nr:cell division protein ZapA [Neisseria sp. 51.81]MDD9327524.1 cell division protein ZapA [Neisseria sp. 51.81]
MTTEHVPVRLLGRSFTIGAPQSETARLADAVARLNEKAAAVRASGRVLDNEQIIVMAALNVVHDLLRDVHAQHLANSETARKIAHLIELCGRE